jgi:F-type H+-transporting ATPase subunit delta
MRGMLEAAPYPTTSLGSRPWAVSFTLQDGKKRTLVADVTTSRPGNFVAGGMAGRYATALYELAADKWLLDEVMPQVAALESLLARSADLRTFIADRALSAKQAGDGIAAVLAREGFGETLRNFVGVIAANRRLSRLPEILAAFNAVTAARRGEVAAEIVSAVPLTDVQRIQLRARLAEAGYSRVDIRERVDSALLGGLVVRVGARLYDTSLQGRLTRLHHAMKGAA